MDGSPTITDHRSMPVAARGGYGLFLLSTHLLGGASRINASIVTRGMAGGYNDWAESCGLTDWSWDKVEPYFKSLETTIEAKSDPSRGDSGESQMFVSWAASLTINSRPGLGQASAAFSAIPLIVSTCAPVQRRALDNLTCLVWRRLTRLWALPSVPAPTPPVHPLSISPRPRWPSRKTVIASHPTRPL